jgi:hypothetical protein
MQHVRTIPPSLAITEAHRESFKLEPHELAACLADKLGRPTLARLTQTSNPNTVTKWRTKKAIPENFRVDRMREAYQIFFALTRIGLSEINAEQWFRGKNPILGLRMPVDVLAEGQFELVVEAFKGLVVE